MIVFFILGSEFFINYRLVWRGHHDGKEGQTLVVALGAGLGVWGAINLLEGYGNDNPGSKSQGMKQFMAN